MAYKWLNERKAELEKIKEEQIVDEELKKMTISQ